MTHPLVRLSFAPLVCAALAFGHFAFAETPVYTITTLPADEITPRSATLHGVFEANGTKASGVFEWGETPALGQQTTGIGTLVPHTEPEPIRFSFFDSLLPNTTYYFRAKLVDGGVVLFGETLSFTTASPTAPGVSVPVPSGATATSVRLLVGIDTGGLDTTLEVFVGGVSRSSQLVPAANLRFPLVIVTVSGLQRDTTYSAYAVATNSVGAATSNEVTFTTAANYTPYANSDTILIPYGKPAQLDVLANDTDIDGDTLTITQAGTDGAGQVTTDGTALDYTPAAGFSGSVQLHYVISDGFGGSASANAFVTVQRPAKPVNVVLLQTGDAVPGMDSTSWLDFGMPALNGAGRIAMKGRIMGPTGVASAVVGRAPTEFGVVLKTGDFTPDETGALSSEQCVEVFDPVINQAGHTAFLAGVVEPAVGSVPKEALFTNVRLGLQRLAESGSPAPGAGGAVWDHFISISAQSNEIVVVARLSGPGVTDANAMGAWAWGVEGPWPWDPTAWRLLLREGDPIAAASGSKTVASFAMLGSVTGSSGQQRHHAFNAYSALVRTTDGVTGIAHGTKNAPFTLAVRTDAVVNVRTATKTISGARWKTIGVPAANWPYPAPDYVFSGKLRPGVPGVLAANAAGIFGRDHSVGGIRAYARAGDVVHSRVGASLGVKYAGFQNPVLSEDDAALVFTATVAGSGVTAANDTVLAYGDGTKIVALTREGNLAPGTAARFSNFLSVAAMNRGSSNIATPLFTAQLSGVGVTLSNNKGLWACDQRLKPQLLLRKGTRLQTATGFKTIRNFTVLAPADGSPGVTRSFNNGSVVSRVTFTDATQAIVLSVMP
jgi:hypothetical protein